MAQASHPATRGRKHTAAGFVCTTLKILALLGIVVIGGDWLLERTLCRPGEWKGPVTDHFNGTFFYNPEAALAQDDAGAGSLIRWAKKRHEKGEYPQIDTLLHHPQLKECLEEGEVEVTMINHSTMLVRMKGVNILTDPIWSDYTSPVQFGGPRRKRPAGMRLDELPHIDVCLLSHDHYDHFDVDSLRGLVERDNPLFVVPLGLKSLLEYHCGHVRPNEPLRVVEKDWWQSADLPGGLQVTLTPAHHWSRRYRTPESACRSLWCGFYLHGEGHPSVYYAGDTARCAWFTQIRKRLGSPDLALLPIGAYKPDWIRRFHQSPAEAVIAMQELGCKQSLACHFGTWQLANEGYQETLDDLHAALKEKGIPEERFHAPDNGETFLYTPAAENSR